MKHFRGIMVTEGRAPIANIAFESYMWQTELRQTEIALVCPPDQVNDYPGGMNYSDRWVEGSVPMSINAAVRYIQDTAPDFICGMWDDDDIAPATRIERTRSAIGSFDPRPVIVSYNKGWFVNARTLHGYMVELDYLWGGCLAWNAEAFNKAVGFPEKWPGQDRAFVEKAQKEGVRTVVIRAPDNELPIAMCHDKNVATHYSKRGDPMERRLEQWLPKRVFKAVKEFQKFCIDRRIFPPWSD